MCAKWSPFFKQCFVTAGVSLNYMSHGMVISFTSVLIPALKQSTEIPVDDAQATWIASVFGISLIIGTLMVPWSINRLGRKPVHICSSVFMAAGWVTIVLATDITTLLLGRLLQGFSMGILAILGSILIGEYVSPRNRGPLLATITLCIMTGILITHTLGTFVTWRTLGIPCAIVSLLDLIIILYSPESPSYLATRGKYEECRKVFLWLRGHDEEEEVNKLIKSDMNRKKNAIVNDIRGVANRITNMFICVKMELSKKELKKPIVIALHLYAMNLWCGAVTFDTYTKDIIDIVVGKNISFRLVIVSLDIQRTISSIIGLIAVTKLRRKLAFAIMSSVNIFGYLSIALYVFLKTQSLLKFDHPLIGIVLLHIYTFSQSAGSMTLSNIIPGEIFPLRHRGLCGMIGTLFFSINETIDIKTVPYLLSSIGLHGTFLAHGSLVIYFALVVFIMLPETKNRTLLDIEEEFRGESLTNETSLLDAK